MLVSITAKRLTTFALSTTIDFQNVVRPTHLRQFSTMSACLNTMFNAKKTDVSPNRTHQRDTSPSSSSPATIIKAGQQYGVTERNQLYTSDFKCYVVDANGPISPWHDIPLTPKAYADKGISGRIFNMVVEIPRWTNAKMEINKANPFNPIMQDIKKGKVRFVDNVFPYNGYIWNYGALPQTWEDPECKDHNTGCIGDGDPIDALEIGEKILERGAVVQVKALGILALIDEGETDWKVITINVNDPLAAQLDTMQDVERLMPGYAKATLDWFRLYKVPTGKPENQFAFNGEIRDATFACKIIAETAQHWQLLTCGQRKIDTYSCQNARLKNATSWKSADEEFKKVCSAAVNAAAAVPNGSVGGGAPQQQQQLNAAGAAATHERLASDTVHKWHFIQNQQ